ncbi:MAG: metal-dependent hydrolase [Desulfosalsimonadaceae bacterium]
MKIKFLGHSGFIIEDEKTIVIDPFLSGNPVATMSEKDLTGADIVLVTHSHADHLGDALTIAKKTGAALVGAPEVVWTDEISGEGMNFGGTAEIQGTKVTMVKAEHSTETGDSAGFVWKQGGHTLYHMGDTGLFSDIRIIAERHKPDILFVPIGDRFTMGPDEAAIATKWVNPEIVIPMHFATLPFLVQDPQGFSENVQRQCSSRVVILKPGEEVNV